MRIAKYFRRSAQISVTGAGIACIGITVGIFWSACSIAQAPPPAGFPGDRVPEGPPAEILAFSVEEAEIEPGDSTTLQWEVINAYSLTIEPDVGTVATRSSREVSPPATTECQLTAIGTGGQVTRSCDAMAGIQEGLVG